MIGRVPIRLRLALGFALFIAALIIGGGLLLRQRAAGALDSTIDQGLRSRLSDLETLVSQADNPFPDTPVRARKRSRVTERGDGMAQVVDASGRILDATPQLRRRAALDHAQLARALRGTVWITRTTLPGVSVPVRLAAAPVRAEGRRLVVVAGAPLGEYDDVLHEIVVLILIGGPIAFVVVSAAGYLLASAALRPVESMRRRAREISGKEPGQRLPVPRSRDEIRRLGETLNGMLTRIDDAMTRERTFVSDASHELRTPLGILKGELELAMSGERSRDELRAAVGSAAEETDRLVKLAEDLLVVARADQGALAITRARTPMVPLLEEVRDRFALRAADLDREVRVHGSPAVAAEGDRLRLEQAVANLLENALRYGRGEVTMSAVESVDAVEIHVRDRGEGFDEEFLPAAFHRFTRGDHARARGGAGLGLSIVLAIAEAHGGTAGAENPPEGGADVWLRIPRAPAEAAPAPEPGPPAERVEVGP